MKLLDTFELRDSFNWALEKIEAEGLECAKRRADLMGWSDVSVKLRHPRVRRTSTKTNEHYTSYTFEIYGEELLKETK